MGNVLGCVRGPKEECYGDSKKAPLRPGSKELKGRRYFQRKKRKTGDFQPAESRRSSGREACGGAEPWRGPDGNTEEPQAGLDKPSQVKPHLSTQDSLSRAVHVGEVSVVVLREPGSQTPGKSLVCRLGRFSTKQADVGRSRSCVEGKLHGINVTLSGASARDGQFVKKLLQRQLRKAVSFGAVEHMLLTLRGNDRTGSEEAFAKIIRASQANRGRRQRSYTCSGYAQHYPGPAKSNSTPQEVKL